MSDDTTYHEGPLSSADPLGGDRDRTVRWLAASFSATVAAVHFGYAPHHLQDDWAHGWFFVLIGAFQVVFAITIVSRPRRWLWWSAIVVNSAIIATWVTSRTSGLPFGPEALRKEVATAPDIVCTILEAGIVLLAAVAVALPAFLSRPSRESVSARFTAGALATVAIVLGALMLTPTYTSAHATGGSEHTHADSSALTGTTPCELAGAAASPGQVATDAEGHSHRGPTAQVPISQADRQQLEVQQAQAREVPVRYPTVADAEAAGYKMSVAFVPCIGAHYTNARYAISFDPAHPSELLYDGTSPDSKIVGLSYLVWSPSGPPAGFAGANDLWHQHNFNGGLCMKGGVVVGGEALSDADCTARGGRKAALDSVWMLHDWIVPGWECTWGVFAGECPELGGRTGGTAWDDPSPGSAGAQLQGLANN
jgi:hypothetical protein